jgi:hypothetical protein
MNIADSIKHVLKNNEGPSFFVTFWKKDLKVYIIEMGKTLKSAFGSKGSLVKNIKEKGFKGSLRSVKESAVDTAIVFKEAPRRVQEAFSYFRDDMVRELEELPDQKQRAIFCMKVIGALTSFSLGAVQNIKRSRKDQPFLGLKNKSALTQFLMAEVVLKVSQLFILRFMTEIEMQLDNEDEIRRLRYFKTILKNASDPDLSPSPTDINQDEAIHIVEALKNYILTGQRKV